MPSSPRRPLPFTVTQKDEEKMCVLDVSFGSKADMKAAENAMSALPPKADICSAQAYVR